MSCDGFTTTDTAFAAALCYVFEADCLTQITTDDSRRKQFHLAVPSEDARIFLNEWNLGTFAVSDLKAFMRQYVSITQLLRDLVKRGEDSWVKHEHEPWEIVPKKGRK
jgi:hypothetical protein